MKYAVYYYSKTGHTKLLADAIADILGVKAHTIYEPLNEDVDVLFFGSSVYGNSIDPAIVDFFSKIETKVGCIVSFGTSGMMKSSFDDIKALAESYNIPVCDLNFHVLGEFAGINKDHPTRDDILNVRKFASDFL